jgi:hypothetical protein
MDRDLESAKLIVAILGLGATFVAGFVGFRTFLRTEKWKRAEFLAREMKEFFGARGVQNALLLIDWGARDVPLFDPAASHGGRVHVTRRLQVFALRPHTLLDDAVGSDLVQGAGDTGPSEARYTPEEAAIRDCYDAFLDGLERLSSYVQTGLVDVADLRPYLNYWVNDIHAPARDGEDAAWAAAFLTYIHFYKFAGVQWLFRAFGKSIDPAEAAYRGFLAGMDDQALADQLNDAAGNGPRSSATHGLAGVPR